VFGCLLHMVLIYMIMIRVYYAYSYAIVFFRATMVDYINLGNTDTSFAITSMIKSGGSSFHSWESSTATLART
jgi:hypothetical protein